MGDLLENSSWARAISMRKYPFNLTWNSVLRETVFFWEKKKKKKKEKQFFETLILPNIREFVYEY